MKLIKVNDSTAKTVRGKSWFKTEIKSAHRTWPTCSKCHRSTNSFWEPWPKTGEVVCENCVKLEEE